MATATAQARVSAALSALVEVLTEDSNRQLPPVRVLGMLPESVRADVLTIARKHTADQILDAGLEVLEQRSPIKALAFKGYLFLNRRKVVRQVEAARAGLAAMAEPVSSHRG
jgi:hypothetical protein